MSAQFIQQGKAYWVGRERLAHYQVDLADNNGTGGYIRLTLCQSQHGRTTAQVTFLVDHEDDADVVFKHSFSMPLDIAKRLAVEFTDSTNEREAGSAD